MTYEEFLQEKLNLVKHNINMFSIGGTHLFEFTFPVGWLPIMTNWVNSVQAVLKENPEAVLKIVSVKERYGTIELVYTADGFKNQKDLEKIDQLTAEAEIQAFNSCIVCSRHGKIRVLGKSIGVTCEDHKDLQQIFADQSYAVWAKYEGELEKLFRR